MMNRTFTVIRNYFPEFDNQEWDDWFTVKLTVLLPSFNAEMLSITLSYVNCTDYQVIIFGLNKVIDEIPNENIMEIIGVLVEYLKHSISQNNNQACKEKDDAVWLSINLGKFSKYVSYSDLKNFNITMLGILDFLSPEQKVELLFDPLNNALENETIVIDVFKTLTSPDELKNFFGNFIQATKKRNLTVIENSAVRNIMLNLTLTALAPGFYTFLPNDFALWFQSYLLVLMPSLQPSSLDVIPRNISCDSYDAIWLGLDKSISSLPEALTYNIKLTKVLLIDRAAMCVPSPIIKCEDTPVIESSVCAELDWSAFTQTVTSGTASGTLCNVSIADYVCSSEAEFTKENLVNLLTCELASSMNYSVATWKLLFAKFSSVLDEALDSYSVETHINNSIATSVLDAIEEVRINNFSNTQLQNISFINQWFQRRLHPFLPSVSEEFLSCLSTKNFSCETYQAVVKSFNNEFLKMREKQQLLVFQDFIMAFLSQSNSSDAACVSNTLSNAEWLGSNFGNFSVFASVSALQRLLSSFSPLDALGGLTLEQLTEVACTPGLLKNPKDVDLLMSYMNDFQLATFFSVFSEVIQGQESTFPSSVLSAMLQQVLDRGILSGQSISDNEVLYWLQFRIGPLLTNMTEDLVAPLFNVFQNRSCATIQALIQQLNSVRSTLQDGTQNEIYNQILSLQKGPVPLRCYSNNSFYSFLDGLFLGFPFPTLSTILSFMPGSEKSQLISSMPPSDLGSLLRRPNIIGSNAALCAFLNCYNRTCDFLETEEMPDNVRQNILPCVWPLAISSANNACFNALTLNQYLGYLSKDLISSTVMLNASCLAFQNFISVLGNSFNYSSTDFNQADVFNTIRSYLSIGEEPKCYKANDPKLNSTAWFVNYIGPFIEFMTLDDLNKFGSTKLQVFMLNPANLQLFSVNSFPQNVSSFFTELIYQQDPNFSPLLLPLQFRCTAPGTSYSQLSIENTLVILQTINQACGEIDPEITTALAGNLPVSENMITALGQECAGFTTTQILGAPPNVLMSSLGTLSAVNGWNQGQAASVIQVLLKQFQIDSGQKLLQLGTLIIGVPSVIFRNIQSSQLLQISQYATFLSNIMNAPEIIQYTFVSQIINISTNTQSLLMNVPDIMATQIPRSLLDFSSVSTQTNTIELINKKTWKPDQAIFFFDVVANGISTLDNISPDVLQGFTCTRAQLIPNKNVVTIIKACQKKRKNVVLQETQLTCMYNYIKVSQLNTFAEYPPEMLLYYNYETDVTSDCTSYFTNVGAAKFDVLSDMLSFIKTNLLQNAKHCLGISGTSLSANNVQVLGNMVCTLNGSYIQNSDSLILEKLKNCNKFSMDQVTAMENLLFTGATKYGNVSSWNIQTLEDLGILPLYFTSIFWNQFTPSDINSFLKTFLVYLRSIGTERLKLKNLFTEIQKSSRFKRDAGCTAPINAVIISDVTFPFAYSITQFTSCLSPQTAVDNLAALAEKVYSQNFQMVVLDKLNQAYPSSIPEEQVQLLGSISRVASLEDISKWNITKIDTLSALMNSSDGAWDPLQSNAIITKYLSTKGNTLGTPELNSMGGTVLCSLDIDVLSSITIISLRNANPLDISNCSLQQKNEIFTIAVGASPRDNTTSLTTYQEIQPYLGGSSIDYVRSLSKSSVNMDLPTFISLDKSVILALTVKEVKSLLGSNLPQLKTYDNVNVIQDWIKQQYQSDLNTLGLGLTGGKVASTTGPQTTTKSTVSGAVPNTLPGGVQTKSVQILLSILFVLGMTVLLQ
ncbi:uncharacterized protein LOC125742379 isoform X2 [Brienomyrus brachyistius]|uniref:uncharacterized protein LOC125742379 isoform X2 n=1 Tax=Brienomyrus brachyistius TaxID=42636 RepID=UPI0020B1AB35|nr:uncharacterized protein LOC125742379 isoform X2 [Brienomyrus brachyistius]